jgi:hypothetical protein
MGRVKIGLAMELIIGGALILSMIIIPACRKEGPLLDRNRVPETTLTSSPTETTSTNYRVHLYWCGKDDDGVVTRYIWYVSDTLMTLDPDENPDSEELDWNPSERIADYLKGRFTTRTDTTIIFKGFDTDLLATVNRQAFHIAAIDDGGKIDPTPARLQFNAYVKGVPVIVFWVNLGGGDRLYSSTTFDTISMKTPFEIKFNAYTVNNVITGYRWSYGGNVYPDYNGDKTPDWYIPASQSEKVVVQLSNSGNEALESGPFNFKGIARDEAGALSVSDLATGVGVCRIVVNHDPDTRLEKGQCFFTPMSTGIPESLDVYFSDSVPDTLPYNSLLRMLYWGWDDPKDRASLVNDPPLPIRFQFAYNRWAVDDYGQSVANKQSSWYPLEGSEDTNPGAGVDDLYRDRDSTTMRVGTFNYRFMVRSFDEQRRADGTPAIVSFYGNFPPKIDSVRAGFWDRQGSAEALRTYHCATNDTIIIGWDGTPYSARGDTMGPYQIKITNPPSGQTIGTRTHSYRFNLQAGSHDDPRDPAGSGIKGWAYHISAAKDLTYSEEGETQYDQALNFLDQACAFTIAAPYSQTNPAFNRHIMDSITQNPPAFLGLQQVTVVGSDISDKDPFSEGLRGSTPEYDDNGYLIPGQNNWIQNTYYFERYARKATRHVQLYLKFVK